MSNTKPSIPGGSAEPHGEKRRTQRVHISMPVVIKGVLEGDNLKEETQTISVNAFGGLLRIAADVKRGQKILLYNARTQEEILCTVIFVGQKEGAKTQVGFEFAQASPLFWRIAFPPEDWDPAERKLPTGAAKPSSPAPKSTSDSGKSR
jgi:hypothetical protein